MKKVFVIRAYARPCGTMLSLNVDGKSGKSQFIATNVRSRKTESIPLSQVATEEILKEISEKSCFNAQWGYALQNVALHRVTKDFINNCWEELKTARPQFCIK